MRFKLTGVLLACALSAALGLVTTAQAAPAPAAGCRAEPYSASFNLYFETEPSYDLGPYRTTRQCNDINLKSTNGTSYRACVIFIDRTQVCNQGNTAPASGAWVNIATNVKDGTRFKVRVFKGGGNYVIRSGVMDF